MLRVHTIVLAKDPDLVFDGAESMDGIEEASLVQSQHRIAARFARLQTLVNVPRVLEDLQIDSFGVIIRIFFFGLVVTIDPDMVVSLISMT